MEELKHQVELVLGVDNIPQPETHEQARWQQKESTQREPTPLWNETLT